MQRQTIDARRQRSARFWKWTFIISGIWALACFPAVFVFEHFQWFEALLHLTAFSACILAATGAVMYLSKTRGAAGNATTFGVSTRALALTAVLAPGDFLLLLVGLAALMSLVPDEF